MRLLVVVLGESPITAFFDTFIQSDISYISFCPTMLYPFSPDLSITVEITLIETPSAN